jgi:hypothetical protein
MYIEANEDCGTVKLKVLAEVNSLKYFCCYRVHLHPNIKAFLDFTFSVIEQGKPHEMQLLYLGREDLIPVCLQKFLKFSN